MFENLMKPRQYPIALLGIPENHLDLITFIMYICCVIAKFQFKLPMWFDLGMCMIFLMIVFIFRSHNKNHLYQYSIQHASAASLFFGCLFITEIFKLI